MVEIKWFRYCIAIIGIFSIIALIVNWLITGKDIPNGVLTLVSIVISVAAGPDAIRAIFNKKAIEEKANEMLGDSKENVNENEKEKENKQ